LTTSICPLSLHDALPILLWGIPEPEGLRCPYHGWLFDDQGNCLEQPAEPSDSTFKDRIKVQSYPVEELGGMLWAWMGPEPRPMIDRKSTRLNSSHVKISY